MRKSRRNVIWPGPEKVFLFDILLVLYYFMSVAENDLGKRMGEG